jgi:microcystin-dependent protein
MDLIYMNTDKEDVGVLKDYTLDLEFGSESNNFECAVSSNNHVCDAGFYLYYENAEYGGVIDSIAFNTDSEEVIYKGRTWHGILESKILEPDKGADYLIVEGDANTVLSSLISRMGLDGLFKVSTTASSIDISYQMHRYVGGYTGIQKMLKKHGAKLYIEFKKGFVELSAKPLIDYSQDEQFDTDQITFNIQKNYKPINHVICLGKGELKNRRVIHVYADKEGNISGTQTLTGMDEVSATYENANVESDDELSQGGIDIINASWSADTVDFSFDSDKETFDVGDIIGAMERTTGAEVKAYITSKIVNISKGTTSIQYGCNASAGASSGGFPSSGGGGESGGSITVDSELSETSENPVQNKIVTKALKDVIDAIYPVGSIYMSVANTNPSILFGGTWQTWGSGKVPVGVDTNDDSFSAVEKTGGTKTHTLTEKEMPSHTHTFTGSEVTSGTQSADHTHSFAHTHGISKITNGTTSEDTHSHTQRISNSTTAGTGMGIGGSQFTGSSNSNLSTSSDTHSHTVTIPAHNTSSQSTSTTGKQSASHTHKVTAKGSNSNTGSGQAHNNLQPYITCYMWKRTA